MNKVYFTILLILSINFSYGQIYNSYLTGSSDDLVCNSYGGICLMGGATENDEAMKWFLRRANGGDVLVLRSSGSDGYNNYIYSTLGIELNSVETIVFNDASAINSNYIHQKIKNAEAIWFAGGDQSEFISYWRGTPIDSLINKAINSRNIVIGGTSAGMAILGGFYFTAQNGTVSSISSLANPFHNNVTVDSLSFIKNDYLTNIITDSHYDNPDRKGRHIVFLSRIFIDYGIMAKGIACDEYTAICIDEHGIARIFGAYPVYDDNAYFLQINCELSDVTPEKCLANYPLNWNLGGNAIKVYSVKGTNSGANTFDLTDWETGVGGVWENWYVDEGVLYQDEGNQINCNSLSINKTDLVSKFNVFPNPVKDFFRIKTEKTITTFSLYNPKGCLLFQKSVSTNEINVDIELVPNGIYILKVISNSNIFYSKIVKE